MRRNLISIITLCAALWASAQVCYSPPVKLAIDSQEAFDRWTTINFNENVTFAYSADNGAEIAQDKSSAMNNWLISPAVELEGGTSYKLKMYCKRISTFSSDKAAFTISAGTEATAEGQTSTIHSESSFQSSLFKDVEANFIPDASGVYYFGIHMTTKSYNGGFAIQYLDIQPVLPLPAAVTGLTVASAPEGVQEAVLSWTWPDKSNLGGALEQIGGAYIYRGTSSYFTANEASLVGTYTGEAQPGGAAQWTDTTVPSPGKYYYRVVPFNDNGTSPSTASAVQSEWIGKDTGLSGVSDVVATVSPDSETTVLLSFTLPKGSNGGYVDTSDIAYKITRKSGQGSTVTLEEQYSGGLPYVDSTIPGLDSYVYQVYTVYNGSTSWSAVSSNTIVTGGTASLPYSQDFSATNSTDLFTFFHGAGASRDWGRSSNALNYWGSPADAWAVLPKFHLEAGKAYAFDFTARVSRATSPKDLYVYIGTAATAEALDRQLFYETVTSTLAEKKTVVISVDETGDYCIAFRCYGSSDSNDIYVDDITLEETVITPMPVTDLSAEAVPEGELKVTLSWTNPAQTTAGGEITVLDKVEVLSGTDVLTTVDTPAAGTESSVTVTVDAPGFHTFTVVPWLAGQAGQSTEATSAWVGHDTPKAPEGLTVEVNDTERIITFEAVTEGVNGGYIDTDALRYTVTRNEETLADDLDDTVYTDTDDNLQLAMYTYTVSAHCGDITGEATAAAPVQLGQALGLPYTPDFSDAATFDLWSFSKTAGGTDTWRYSSSDEAISSSSTSAWAYTPPFFAEEGTAKVSFKVTATMQRYIRPISVYLCTENNAEARTEPTLITEFTPTGIAYPDLQTATFDIPASGRYHIGYLTDPDNWGTRLHQSDIEQLTVTTGITDTLTPGGVTVNTDGSLSFGKEGTVTLYSLSGVAVWSASAHDGTLTPEVQPGLYVAAWRAADGTAMTFKYTK